MKNFLATLVICCCGSVLFSERTVSAADNVAPAKFRALFNGKDLAGWHGQKTASPREFNALSVKDRSKRLVDDAADMEQHWIVENGEIINDGKGVYLTTDEDFGDYEFLIDYKTVPKGDSGIYLKETPQVQIWDWTEEEKFKLGADKGSGGLWNNLPGNPGKDPLVKADKPFGEWNTFRILQVGARTTIYLNGQLVVNHAILDNYWDKQTPKGPIPAKGKIQLQTHGAEIRWKNIYIREIPSDESAVYLGSKNDEGFVSLFNGTDLTGWAGATDNYEVVDGAIRCKASKGGNLLTEKDYANFVVRLEMLIPPGGNNGLAIRSPLGGDAAYSSMCELQVLDNEHPMYMSLDNRQYHGSAYGMAAAHRGYLRPAGQWNFQEVTIKGSTIKVELNGSVILDTDLATVTKYLADKSHPGKDRTTGRFGFAGHGDPVSFRKIRIKTLE